MASQMMATEDGIHRLAGPSRRSTPSRPASKGGMNSRDGLLNCIPGPSGPRIVASKSKPPEDCSRPKARITSLFLMKNRVSQWRRSRLRTWNLGGEGSHTRRPTASENSYKMEPESGTKFAADKVRQVLEETMLNVLGLEARYDPAKSALLCRVIAEEAKVKLKQQGYSRYKIVVHVAIGQNKKQGTHVASRCMWDPEADSSATATFRTGDMFAVANAFGVYFE